MDENIKVKLITPTKLEVDTETKMVIVPGVKGSFAVLPRKAPIISHIEYGMVLLCESKDTVPTKGDKGKRFFIGSGVVEASNNVCTILVDEAIPVDEVDKIGIASRVSVAKSNLKDKSIPKTTKDKLKISISFLEYILDTLERENPRPVIKGR